MTASAHSAMRADAVNSPQADSSAPHVPVLLPEVLQYLDPQDGETIVDCTYGAGGYSRAFLAAAACEVIGIDRDDTAHAAASATDRLTLVQGAFGDIAEHLDSTGPVDGIVADLGVSSMQLDQAERGFSFRFDGPLDMRMDRTGGRTAADLVNETEQGELADIIYTYGEERKSRQIASAIVRRRAEAPFSTTSDLANVVRAVLRKGGRKPEKTDPATRTFQALRIAVNDELGELERLLEASLTCLKPGGRLVMVTFHSLEDRIVKRFLQAHDGSGGGSRHLPQVDTAPADFRILTRRAIAPSDDECEANPRARSAKLRAAVRLAPAGGSL